MSHYIAVALVILSMGIGQILLKKGAEAGNNWLSSFFSVYTLMGYGIYFLASMSNIYALQGLLLKHVTAWIGFSYIVVVMLSRLILGEHVNRQRMLGCVLIAVGVFVFSFPF